ncbi:hypothetical protein IC575_002142 [Cucumis melo]
MPSFYKTYGACLAHRLEWSKPTPYLAQGLSLIWGLGLSLFLLLPTQQPHYFLSLPTLHRFFSVFSPWPNDLFSTQLHASPSPSSSPSSSIFSFSETLRLRLLLPRSFCFIESFRR